MRRRRSATIGIGFFAFDHAEADAACQQLTGLLLEEHDPDFVDQCIAARERWHSQQREQTLAEIRAWLGECLKDPSR